MSAHAVECRACGSAIDVSLDPPNAQAPCHACGSSLRNFNVSIVEAAVARDGLGVKVKRVGDRRPYVEDKGIPSYSHRLGKLVFRHVWIDRDNDWYSETVTDYETGEIVHECKEPLSQHQGHGSAKSRRGPIDS